MITGRTLLGWVALPSKAIAKMHSIERLNHHVELRCWMILLARLHA